MGFNLPKWNCRVWNYLGDIMVSLFSFHLSIIVCDLVGYTREERLPQCSISQRSVCRGEGRVMHSLWDFTCILGFCDGFSSDCVHWGDHAERKHGTERGTIQSLCVWSTLPRRPICLPPPIWGGFRGGGGILPWTTPPTSMAASVAPPPIHTSSFHIACFGLLSKIFCIIRY